MTVQTGNVTYTHKELANLRKKLFKYEKLLLLKSPKNKAASTIGSTEKKLDIIYHTKLWHFGLYLLILQIVKYFIR